MRRPLASSHDRGGAGRDQRGRAPGRHDARRGAGAHRPRPPGAGRGRRRRRFVTARHGVRGRRRHHRDGRGRMGRRHGGQGQGAAAGRAGLPAARPRALHLPPPGGRARGGQGPARPGDDGAGVRDRAARRGSAAAAGAHERGRRPHGHPDRRPLPRARRRRPGRPPRRGARRAPGPGRRHRRRQRGVELGLDRPGHGGRGPPARPQHRPPALRRPDPQGPDHDPGLEPGRGRAGGGRRRPGHRRRARGRRAGARGRHRGHGAGHEAGVGDRRHRHRPGRLRGDHPGDHPRRSGLRAPRRPALRGRQRAGGRPPHVDLRPDQRHPPVRGRRRPARPAGGRRRATRRCGPASTPPAAT